VIRLSQPPFRKQRIAMSTPYLAGIRLTSFAFPGDIGGSGGSTAHANLPPCLAVNFIIALLGIFPARA
jgi:microcystin-dependent protein